MHYARHLEVSKTTTASSWGKKNKTYNNNNKIDAEASNNISPLEMTKPSH